MRLQLSFRDQIHASERGQVTAWTVGIALILFAFMALTTDVGFWLVERRTEQNQADAAVLAGVQGLPDRDNAAAIAQDWLERNGRDASVCVLDEQPSEYTEVYEGYAFVESPVNSGNYTKIRACIEGEGLIIFGSLLDIAGVTVKAVAAAGLEAEPSHYALMAMNDQHCAEAPTLNVRGDANVTLAGDGASYTAITCGDVTETLRVDGNGDLTASYHDYCGVAGEDGSNANLAGQLNDGICGIPDPWVSYAQPTPGACASPPSGHPDFIFANGDHVTLQPGTYCQLVALSAPAPATPTSPPNASITLQPGVYIFREGYMQTGGALTGNDVVLYFTCDTGTNCSGAGRPRDLRDEPGPGGLTCDSHATICIQGTSTVDVEAPDVQPHIVIWIDRTAVAVGEEEMVRLAGQGTIEFDGHIYSWPGEVEIQGQGSGLNFNLTGTILGDTLEFAGLGNYTITWDEDFAPKIFHLSLVE